MCDVYQNAFLNISADHALDAREGCFRDRYFATVDAFKLQLKPLQSTWWVAVDERNLFEWVKDAPSSGRAWIYQERHLWARPFPQSMMLVLTGPQQSSTCIAFYRERGLLGVSGSCTLLQK
jgi:hypothetical protein